MIGVLASMPQMETLSAMSTTSETIMRQPSAEDLDAARQLVSSARGGRDRGSDLPSEMQESRDEDWEVINGSDTGSKMEGLQECTVNMPRGPTEAAALDRVPASKQSPKSQSKEPIFLGHSCRCVLYNPLVLVV